MTRFTKSDLKKELTAQGSYFFTRSTMRFFGDTMQNYSLSSTVVTNRNRKIVDVWKLSRKKPVKCGLQKPTYFDKVTLNRVYVSTAGKD